MRYSCTGITKKEQTPDAVSDAQTAGRGRVFQTALAHPEGDLCLIPGVFLEQKGEMCRVYDHVQAAGSDQSAGDLVDRFRAVPLRRRGVPLPRRIWEYEKTLPAGEGLGAEPKGSAFCSVDRIAAEIFVGSARDHSLLSWGP